MLPWFLGWAMGWIMMSFSELEKKHLVLLVPNDQPYFLIHSAFSLWSPSLVLPFPHSLLCWGMWPLAMTSSVKSFPAPKCRLCGPPLFFYIPWFTSPLQDILPIALSVSFVFTFSPFHHSHRIIISFLQTANYTYCSYLCYHHQKQGLAHISYSK